MIWLRLKGYAIALAAVVLGVLGVYFAGRQSGKTGESIRQADADRKIARRIEDAADRVRKLDGGNVDAIERLRKHKRIRDL
jgi:hypothetical protein